MRAIPVNPEHRSVADAAVAKLLLHGLPHQLKEAKKAAAGKANKSPFQLCMIATDGVSLHLVMARPRKRGDKKKKGDDNDDDDEDDDEPEDGKKKKDKKQKDELDVTSTRGSSGPAPSPRTRRRP